MLVSQAFQQLRHPECNQIAAGYRKALLDQQPGRFNNSQRRQIRRCPLLPSLLFRVEDCEAAPRDVVYFLQAVIAIFALSYFRCQNVRSAIRLARCWTAICFWIAAQAKKAAINAPVVPENSIRRDWRGEAESAHHPMRCLRSSTSLQRL
jgi:hypothetical protein